MRSLSKSKLLAYRQCSKRLWLEVHCPDLKDDSASTQASYQVGNQVGDLARGIYDPKGRGVLIDPQEEGFKAAFARTKELLKSSSPIFEAAFTAAGGLALADVMLPVNRRGERKWRLIEVKSSTKVKPYHEDDVAVQAYIAKKSGVKLDSISVACIDNQWVYPGKENYQGLLKEVDLTDVALTRGKEVKSWLTEAHKIVRKRKEPSVQTGPHCSDPYDCGFYAYCSKKEPQAQYPVEWLPNRAKKKLQSFIEKQNVTEMGEVEDDLLNTRQQRVKQCTLNDEIYFDAKGAAKELSQYKLPAYFLDFETINFAVPIWKGFRPYQQVPFQFSLHKLNRAGKLSHLSFLDLSGKNPTKAFTEFLVKQCGKTGPVYVYNKGFETARIKELAIRNPKLKKPLLAINDRVVDLLPIAREYYYHPEQCGSWSIKCVLPAVAPDLRYDELEGVQDGGMAMEAFQEAIAKSTTHERKAEIEKQLLKYCELDTYAMVRLWQFFSGLTDELDVHQE